MHTTDQSQEDDAVHMEGPAHGPCHWTIFNPQGKIHKHAEACLCDLHSYDVSSFPKGAYMIVMEFDENPKFKH